ncbi:NAD+ synthase [Synechococcales cyanobacterium C]|uniref:Glutamine-dependent NAD(+) synthetase n=2 Tax=Petrachloros TaxID=2918834 RepID=A0A8K2A889_9CYAN|nr:NAD+ synthase [Petrachloros mirabilis ULC683]
MEIAIAQLNPTIGDLAANAEKILAAATQAQGARLLLTPELSLCGYPPRDLLLNPGFVQALEATLHELAVALPPEMAVLVGTVTPNLESRQRGGKPLFNSVAYLAQGQVQQRFHKRLLPTYDVFDEDRYFAPGLMPNLLELDGIKIGVTICEDLWNDEAFWGHRTYAINPMAELVEQSVDWVVNVSASPFCVGKQALREAMLQNSAQRYGCPIFYVNQVGGNDDLVFDGGSVAFDQAGTLVSRCQTFAEDLQVIHIRQGKTQPLAPGLITPRAAPPQAEIWQALVLGVRDYARKCGFTQAVIGLSGGIDSSLVAAIATAALGCDQVLGVLMPSPYSSDHSIDDALALAKTLQIHTETLPIAPLMQGYDQVLAALFAGTEPGVTAENLQARIRGNLLMAIANKFGRLLISTGNKSEMAVGYCTLYGDMNGGLAAIADVPKTQVYALCEWLNTPESQPYRHQLTPLSTDPVIPTTVLTKAPSAELRPDQRDQDSLPPYEILDDILARLIDQHQSAHQIVAAGHDSATVERVIGLVTRAEFKRRQAPPGLKITDRAFGTGWRMPIAARPTYNDTIKDISRELGKLSPAINPSPL